MFLHFALFPLPFPFVSPSFPLCFSSLALNCLFISSSSCIVLYFSFICLHIPSLVFPLHFSLVSASFPFISNPCTPFPIPLHLPSFPLHFLSFHLHVPLHFPFMFPIISPSFPFMSHSCPLLCPFRRTSSLHSPSFPFISSSCLLHFSHALHVLSRPLHFPSFPIHVRFTSLHYPFMSPSFPHHVPFGVPIHFPFLFFISVSV